MAKTQSVSKTKYVTEARFEIALSELKGEFRVVSDRLDQVAAEVAGHSIRVDSLEVKVDRLEVKVDRLEAKLDAGFKELGERIDRANIIFEEQTSQNRVVLDGLKAVWQRQEGGEKRTRSLELWAASKGYSLN